MGTEINIELLVRQGFVSISSIIIGLIVVSLSITLARFTAWKENRSGAIVVTISVVTALLCCFFFRFDVAHVLYAYIGLYKSFADWIIRISNAGQIDSNWAYTALYVASSSIITSMAAVLSTGFCFYWFGFGGEWRLRGAQLKTDRSLINSRNALQFGRTKVPTEVETRGFALFGTTGTGKTQALMKIMATARKRGQKAVIADPGGELMARFYKDGDVILSPEDERSADWSIWADMKHDDECRQFAESVIEPGKGESESWHNSARTLLQVFFERSFKEQKRKTLDVVSILRQTDDELARLVEGSIVERVITGANEKGRDSILSIISLSLQPWERLKQDAGTEAFSIRKFVSARDDRWLWMPYSDHGGKTYEPLRRMWIDIAARQILSGAEDKDLRVWLVLDEMHNQGRLDVLSRAAARGRKYGLAHVLGVHSISQLREVYGHDGAQSILATTGNQLILRAADPDTAEYCSQQIGEREHTRKEKSKSKGENGQSENVQYGRVIDRAVLPSEILNLPDLEGYLQMSGRGQRRVKLDYIGDEFPQRFEPLIRKKSAPIVRPESLEDNLEEVEVKPSESASKLRLKKKDSEPITETEK